MEKLFLSQLLGSNSMLYPVFLAGMFAAVLFRRESIAIPGMFRLAYWLFALAIVVPACLTASAEAVADQPFAPGRMRGVMGADLGWVFNTLFTTAGPALFALSVLCAFGSMLPRKLPPAAQAPPAKHPLD